MCCKAGVLPDVRRVFEEMPKRNILELVGLQFSLLVERTQMNIFYGHVSI
jgi:hypothetical protein